MREESVPLPSGEPAPLRRRLEDTLGASYALGPELGRGGMGIVLRAIDLKLRREVAIKVLPPELARREDLKRRLLREARLAAGLSHPNVVSIYDVGETDDLVWLVMAYVHGETLHGKVAREGPQPFSFVRHVLQGVAWALAYAHARGVVHRDVKPDNIMIEAATGRPVLTDFGIAKALRGQSTALTGSGELIGTPLYMAPEQALGRGEPDGRSDLYSLGLVGYFLLTGEHALRGETLADVLAAHHEGVVPDPRRLRPQIPERLLGALRTALARDPAKRFASAEEFGQALARARPDILETPAAIQRLFRATQRTVVLASLFGVGVGVVGFAGVPAVLSLLALGAVGAAWVRRVEAVIHAGFTWDSVRGGVYAERARYLDERPVRGEALPRVPLASAIWLLTIVGCVFLGVLYLPERPHQGLGLEALNQLVLVVGAFGWTIGARILGLAGHSPAGSAMAARPSVAQALAMASRVCAVVAVWLGLLQGASWAAGGALTASLGVFVWMRYGPQLRLRESSGAEWQLPRTLDWLGSWLLARLRWSRGRFMVQRAEPIGARQQRVLTALARRRQSAIRRALVKLPAAERSLKTEAGAAAQRLGQAISRTAKDVIEVQARLVALQSGGIEPSDENALAALHDQMQRAVTLERRLRDQTRQQLDALRSLQDAIDVAEATERRARIAVALARARKVLESTGPSS